MKTKWVIENFTKEESYQELAAEVTKQGYDLIRLDNGYKQSDLKELEQGKHCVMFLGSIEMTNMILKQLSNCAPVAFCNFENYLCSKYMTHFGKYLFNDRYAMVSLSELCRQKFLYYGTFGKEALIFIRPDSGQKTFQAQLLDIIDVDRFVSKNDHIKNDLVVVSTPKKILWEGRFIVTNKKEIIACSTYRFQELRSLIKTVPTESIKLVKELLDIGYYPDSVFCMDICQDSDGQCWLLELNSFSSAGLYACDKSAIVKRVSEIAEKEFEAYAFFNRTMEE